MKNIFILPTNKASKLFIDIDDNKLKLTTPIAGEYMMNQHIYITNKEEINIGCYYLCKLSMKPLKCTGDEYFNNIDEEKIIMTTDQDLIKDGVQEIDDKFLKWFTNNPSCEEVELMSLREIGRNEYEIIIPEQDNLEKEMFELEQELDIPSHLRWHNSKPKKEIPEEKAEAYARLVWGMYYDNEYDTGTDLTYGEVSKNDFLAGVEYQKQQNKNIYSEEDLREAFRQGQENITYDEMYGYNSDITEDAFIKRFNLQFKK